MEQPLEVVHLGACDLELIPSVFQPGADRGRGLVDPTPLVGTLTAAVAAVLAGPAAQRAHHRAATP